MPRATITRTIDAPLDVVFHTVADINKFSKAIPANAYELFPKVLNPLVMRTIRKAIEQDMDAVKKYCEQSSKVRE